MIIITRPQVENLLRGYQGINLLRQALNKSSGQEIGEVVTQYVLFNHLFGAGVANLASQLAVSNLFRDVSEPTLYNDRSMEVASRVFAAAIDEFGDRDVVLRPTHRMLAQAVVKGVAQYYHWDKNKLDKLLQKFNASIDQKVCEGYGIRNSKTEQDLFKSLGFHVGSELLADYEFKILDRTIHEIQPDLVNHLKQSDVSVSGVPVPAYTWISLHTRVEIDHFEYALAGVNLALKYYVGNQEKEKVEAQIIGGIHHFAAFQEQFMRTLNE